MGERRSATGTFTERVSRAVDRELTEAASVRWEGSPEVFLWRARRCAEALLYALLLRQKADVEALAEQGKSLDELLKHKVLQGFLPREMRNHLELVQKYGNTAAHFQVDGSASEASAGITASALAELFRWYFTRDGGDLPEALREQLAALTERDRRIRSAYEKELTQERLRTQELHRQLAATLPAAPLRAHDDRGAGRAPGIALAVVFMLGGGLAGFAARYVTGTEEPLITTRATRSEDPPPITSVTVAPLAPAPTEPAPPQQTDPPAVPVVDADAAPTPTLASCPNGMSWVPGVQGGVPFCIHVDAVLEGQYRGCVNRGACARPPEGIGCNWQNGANDLAANCITWNLARDYCRWALDSAGDLPTRAEWEAAAHARLSPHLAPQTGEWSADAQGPGRRLVRGSRIGAGGFTWASAPEGQGSRAVGFRCVLRAR